MTLRKRPLGAVVASAVALLLTAWALVPVVSVDKKPLSRQPKPDALEYADAAWQLAHGRGYVMFYNEKRQRYGKVALPPRYPFGTSAALAPFAIGSSHYPGGIPTGSVVISALYVVACVAAAWRIGGPVAAAFAALLVGLSPFAKTSASLVLSDALGALLMVLMLIAFTSRRLAAAAFAGLLAGAAVCVRLLSVFVLPAVAAATRGRPRLVAGVAAIPPIALLAIYQWHTFGLPWRTGYGYWVTGQKLFSISSVYVTHAMFSAASVFGRTPSEGPFVYPDRTHGALFNWICPCLVGRQPMLVNGGPMTKLANAAFYPSVLLSLFWVFAPPFTGAFGIWEMIRQRRSPAAIFGLVTLVLNLAIVLPYYLRAARFVAGPASIVLVYSAVCFGRLLTDLAPKAAGWWPRIHGLPRPPSPPADTHTPSTALPGGA